MSNDEDDGFCHYCGRAPSIDLSLEWDHVPALNVKIPPDCEEVRKTLIRSCKECNILASDHPHMDFLERHFWLKTAYLRRYKRLLINEGAEDIDRRHMSGYLLAAVNNADVKYEEILRAIGFGVREITEIESPILPLRTKKSKRILEHIIIEYFHGIPNDDEEEEPIDFGDVKEEVEDTPPPYDLDEFIYFLADEARSDNFINSEGTYKKWLKKFPNRALSLELPLLPHKHIGVSWDRFNTLVDNILLEDCAENYSKEVQHIIDSLYLYLTPRIVEGDLLLTKVSLLDLLEDSYIGTKREYTEFLQIIDESEFLVHFPEEPEDVFEEWPLW